MNTQKEQRYVKVSKEDYACMLLEELYGGEDKKIIMTKWKRYCSSFS